jgi:hypothetical protein
MSYARLQSVKRSEFLHTDFGHQQPPSCRHWILSSLYFLVSGCLWHNFYATKSGLSLLLW